MSLVVGELTGYLGLDSKKFDSGLDAAHTRFSTFGTKISGIAAGIGKVALMGAAGGIAGLVAGLGAGVVAGMKFNSSIEQTTIAMGTMLGSTDKATKLIGEVTKMAAATPFEFPELADATKRLVAYGVSAKDAVPLMTRLGDVSSALNIPIGEMADLYGKMKVSGRITMEDMNQLAGRGVPIYAALAKQLGVGEGEIRKLVETGKVGFPDIEKAMKGMTDKGGMFAGMMDAQSKSFSGLWSTLKDGVIQTFGAALTPLFNWLVKDIMPKAIELVNKFSAGFAEGGLLGGIKALFGGMEGGISDAIPKVLNKLGELAGKFIDWIGPLIPPMLVKLGEVLLAIGTWVVTVALPAIVTKLGEWAMAFIAWIAPLIGPMIAKFGEILVSLGSWIIDTALPAIVTKLIEWAKAFAAWIGPAIPGILAELGIVLVKICWWIISEALPTILINIGKLVVGLLEALGTLLAPLGTVMAKPFKDAWNDHLKPWFDETWTKIKNFFNAIPTYITSGLAGVWSAMTAPFLTAWNWINDNIVAPAKDFFAWLTGKSASASATLSGLSQTAQDSAVWGPAHALGGVFTKPHWGLVAEAGPEAIIPLSNPSRASQVMQQAGLGRGGGPINIYVSGYTGPDTARQIVAALAGV